MTDKNTYDTYEICTGSYYERPDYCGDESDYYEIGVERTILQGTLEEAMRQAVELCKLRRSEYDGNLVSVCWWICDSDKNVVA